MGLSHSTDVPLEPAELEFSERFTRLLVQAVCSLCRAAREIHALTWLFLLPHHLFSIMEISIFLCSLL